MTDYRYKAFISYSHKDEAWGKWLHRALETYRVPRHLVGSQGRFGQVAARVAPVFRDREDLSSAADLSASVKDELAASETLIVICSPSGAASPWVNEEVRHFRELGRAERIFALVVDGDPASRNPGDRCFPPALVESEDGTALEPLAADARDHADGKQLARLKLVAGIVGIRLDDLRQRDMQRRHRVWMISAAGAMVVAMTTTVLAIVAINARNQAENRREQAENLVGYMVSDLQDDLSEVGRLDILQGMGGEVAKYLESLDSGEVTDTSLQQQALVWRHLGTASMDQWKLDESMHQFVNSRDVLRELYRRDPQDVERVYELAQAEFWVGYTDLERGEYDAAQQALEAYLALADLLGEMEPGNPEWLMERSMAHGNLAALTIRRESNDLARALDDIEVSVELNRRALDIEPENENYLSAYTEALAWAADTQMGICDLVGALDSRRENVNIARSLAEKQPGNVNLSARYAYSLTGLANLEWQAGSSDRAQIHMQEAATILGRLFALDRSNLDMSWGELLRRYYLAAFQAETSEPAAVLDDFSTLYEPLRAAISADESEYDTRSREWVRFRIDYAQAAWRAGEAERAEKLWSAAVDDLRRWISSDSDGEPWVDELVKAKFVGWRYASAFQDPMPNERLDSGREHISCVDRSLLAMQALIDGDQARAVAHAQHLLERGYAEPAFMRICRHYGLCPGAELH